MFKVLVVGSLFFTHISLAEGIPTLPGFPAIPTNPLSLAAHPEPTCEEIIPRLEAYKENIVQNEDAVLVFIDQVAQTAVQWEQLLQPLENTSANIPVGTFSPLKNYGEKIGEVITWGYDNRNYFEAELGSILDALKKCNLK